MVNPPSRTSAGVRNPTRVRTSRQLRTGRTPALLLEDLVRTEELLGLVGQRSRGLVAGHLLADDRLGGVRDDLLELVGPLRRRERAGAGELLLGLPELRLVAVGLDVGEVVAGGGGPDGDRVLGHELTAAQPLDQLERLVGLLGLFGARPRPT